MVILKGIIKDLRKEELSNVIKQQNPRVPIEDSSDFQIKFVRKNRNDCLYNAVVEVHPKVRHALLEIQRVHLDHQRVRVEEFTPFIQCYKCLQFGHTKSKCKSTCTPCSFCASKDHQFDSCPDKDVPEKTPKCFNCTQVNSRKGVTPKPDSISHSATDSKSCGIIKSMISRLKSRIDYGFIER